MELVLQAASAIAFYIFIFVMFKNMYTPKDIKKGSKVIIVTAMVGMMLIGLLQIPILNLLYAFLTIILLNVLLYKPYGKGFIIYDILFLVIMITVDMISVSLLSFVINIESEKIIDNPYLLSAAVVLNWILLFAVSRVYVFVISVKQINNIKIQELLMFLFLICAEIFFLYFINNILAASKVRYELTIILLIFLFLDLYLTYLLNKISESYQIKKRLEVITQQSVVQLNAYKELNEKYNSSRRIIHDVKRHISLLDDLINSNNAKIADKYRSLLNEELDKFIPQFECDNPILTFIINNKLALAEELKIDFKVNVEFSKIDFISDLDITIIFSNLLDNAFEACGEVAENKHQIQITIARHNYFLFIYLKNNFKTVDIDINNLFKSTKKNHQGIGLSNIKYVVENYNGNYNVIVEDGLFKTEILIPIPDSFSF